MGFNTFKDAVELTAFPDDLRFKATVMNDESE